MSGSLGYLDSGRREGEVEMGLGVQQDRGMRRHPEPRRDRKRWVGRGHSMMVMQMRMGRERMKS